MSSADTRNNPVSLARLAQTGDREAFTEFYNHYLTPVYRYVLARVRSSHEADDITQTVFMKAYEHAHVFAKEGSKPLAYLYTIARNTIIDYWKKRKEVSQSDAEEVFEKVPDEQAGPAAKLEQREVAERVRGALAHLTEEQREVVSLKYLNDYSTAEIASHLKKSEMAVRQILSRGLRALRPFI